jgi:hypothetical protein
MGLSLDFSAARLALSIHSQVGEFKVDSGQTDACFATIFRLVSVWRAALVINGHACSGAYVPQRQLDSNLHTLKAIL